MKETRDHRYRRLTFLAKALVSVGLLAWLLHKAGIGQLANAIKSASWQWLLLGLLFGFASTAVQTSQWHALLRAKGLRRRWFECLRLVYVGNTFNTILPTSIGGDVVRATMVADHPTQRTTALTTVVLQRLCNFPGMIVIMAVGVAATVANPVADRVRPIALLGITAGIVGLGICLTPLLGWLSMRGVSKKIRLANLFQQLHEFRGQRRELILASLRGTSFWALSVLNQWSFMHAVGINVDLTYAAVVTTTVNAITLLPISVNGYGLREGGFVAFLTVRGLASYPAALAASFCLAAQSLLWGVIGIPFYLVRTRRRTANPVTVKGVRTA